MNFLLVLLFMVTVILVLVLIYYNSYNSLLILKIKMDNAEEIITNKLKEKHKLMSMLSEKIKKVIKKKDYLKEFNALKINKLTNYELDKILSEQLITMINIKEDHKELDNDEYNNLLSDIKYIDQTIMANKKYFNKNNNILIKQLNGINKIVAQISKITIKNSYETKEPK